MQLYVAAVQHMSSCTQQLEAQGKQPDISLNSFVQDNSEGMHFIGREFPIALQHFSDAKALSWTSAPVYMQWSTINAVASVYFDLLRSGQCLANLPPVTSTSSGSTSGRSTGSTGSGQGAQRRTHASLALAAEAHKIAHAQTQLLPPSHAALLRQFGGSTHAVVWLAASFSTEYPRMNLRACFFTHPCVE